VKHLDFVRPLPWPDHLRRHRTLAEVDETERLLSRQADFYATGRRFDTSGGYRLAALLARQAENNPPTSKTPDPEPPRAA
jgi:hypothetical protein